MAGAKAAAAAVLCGCVFNEMVYCAAGRRIDHRFSASRSRPGALNTTSANKSDATVQIASDTSRSVLMSSTEVRDAPAAESVVAPMSLPNVMPRTRSVALNATLSTELPHGTAPNPSAIATLPGPQVEAWVHKHKSPSKERESSQEALASAPSAIATLPGPQVAASVQKSHDAAKDDTLSESSQESLAPAAFATLPGPQIAARVRTRRNAVEDDMARTLLQDVSPFPSTVLETEETSDILADTVECATQFTGEKLGCTTDCRCAWYQSCFTKYVLTDSSAADGSETMENRDIGICDVNVTGAVLICASGLTFLVLFLLSLRLCMSQWQSREEPWRSLYVSQGAKEAFGREAKI